ncbi:hypothetical protein BT63DRAFT_450881 [Microthyrium microscopicum]|uniref:Uncharacterized protein n=1 Tax=Microthyrium microscopicum TaxID=703497 RepID=A0A6A6UN44_9PEZI|nr:hypothetical protein BT63DRAFT_450881 [Microthyrium microscopicum]
MNTSPPRGSTNSRLSSPSQSIVPSNPPKANSQMDTTSKPTGSSSSSDALNSTNMSKSATSSGLTFPDDASLLEHSNQSNNFPEHTTGSSSAAPTHTTTPSPLTASVDTSSGQLFPQNYYALYKLARALTKSTKFLLRKTDCPAKLSTTVQSFWQQLLGQVARFLTSHFHLNLCHPLGPSPSCHHLQQPLFITSYHNNFSSTFSNDSLIRTAITASPFLTPFPNRTSTKSSWLSDSNFSKSLTVISILADATRFSLQR